MLRAGVEDRQQAYESNYLLTFTSIPVNYNSINYHRFDFNLISWLIYSRPRQIISLWGILLLEYRVLLSQNYSLLLSLVDWNLGYGLMLNRIWKTQLSGHCLPVRLNKSYSIRLRWKFAYILGWYQVRASFTCFRGWADCWNKAVIVSLFWIS